MVREILVGRQVGERLVESNRAVLHQGERSEPEEGHARASVGSPLTIEVHFNRLVEDGVTTTDSLTLYALSEVAHLLGLRV